MKQNRKKTLAFTMIELLVVVVIIGILISLATVSFVSIRAKARDLKRKADLSTIGRFLTANCYLPDQGAGTYDLADLITELKNKDERYRASLGKGFSDPKTGSDTKSYYYYIVNDNKQCLLYANLESANEAVTIGDISSPTLGAGQGVFASSTTGWNGSKNYWQISN